MTDLSEQDLLNCCGNDGLDGGPYCLNWIARRGGLHTYSDYPYTAGDGGITCTGGNSVCQYSGGPILGSLSGAYCLDNDPSGGNEMMVNLIMQMSGPMITSIASSGLAGYNGGIITGMCYARNIDHTVLMVGYGEENGIPYYIMKNSWGPQFGEGGYFRMQANVCCLGFCGGGNCKAN